MNARYVGLIPAAAVLSSVSVAAAQNVDILTQDIALDLTGSETAIHIDATLQAKGSASYLDLLQPGMKIDSFLVDGTPVEPTPHPQEPGLALRVAYPTALSSGQIVQLAISMSGTPSCNAPSPPGAIVCKHTPDETFFAPVRPGAAWYLYNLHGQADPFTGTIEVRAPSSHAVVAGDGAAVAVVDDLTTKTWTFPVDHPTEALGVYAGICETASSASGARTEAYYRAGVSDPAKVQQAVDLTSELLPVYESLFGPLSASPARIVAMPKQFFAGGLGLLGLVLVGAPVFDTHDYLLEQGMAHEFAHSWWGGLASSSDLSQGGFLSEAFAEYAAWRALGELQGDDVRTSGARMSAVWYMYRRPGDADIAVLSPQAAESPLYVFVTYHKGSVVLRTLAEAVGEDAFTDALRAFLARGYGGLSVDALTEDIANVTGHDVTAEVQMWLYESGFPTMTVSTTLGDGIDLRVDCGGPCGLGAPVRLTFADGQTATHVVPIASGATDHHIDTAERPVAVEFDPRWTLVREVVPALEGDVTLDGAVDAADLLAVALHSGTALPEERRRDGRYDPLYDLDHDRLVGDADLDAVLAAAPRLP